MPVSADLTQFSFTADYAYSMNAAQDGWWSGVWGILRSYKTLQPNLYNLGNTLVTQSSIANSDQFKFGVCPIGAPNRVHDVTAVLANDVLDNSLNVVIPANAAMDSDGDGTGDNLGAPLDTEGGTLVYNPRPTELFFQPPPVPGEELPDPVKVAEGPLHDPTAMLLVRTDDLVATGKINPSDRRACRRLDARDLGCKVELKEGVPMEPLVLRANAGDCIQVWLRNRLPVDAPDLAGYNTLLQMVIRDRDRLMQDEQSVVTFNNNLIKPSSHVGLHPQMVEYDVTLSDGTNVGINPQTQTAEPTGRRRTKRYIWYAGDLSYDPATNTLNHTDVEFGGTNLIPADNIKQGQKGMVGALVIEPKGSSWNDSLAELEQVPNRQDGGETTVGTRADLRINEETSDQFEDLVVMAQKGLNHRFKDGSAVPNIASEGQGIPEDSHDSGQKGINYGSEPAWFRFGIAADANFGNAGAPGTLGSSDAELMFSNSLSGDGPDPGSENDYPWTGFFTAPKGKEARIRLLQPTGVGRGSTFDLHGHVWARDPYLPETPSCLTASTLASCGLSSVSIGDNPLAWYLGGQESWMPYGHFDIVLPSAGGVNEVTGDYLFRDHASFGVTDGIWGILQVD